MEKKKYLEKLPEELETIQFDLESNVGNQKVYHSTTSIQNTGPSKLKFELARNKMWRLTHNLYT